MLTTLWAGVTAIFLAVTGFFVGDAAPVVTYQASTTNAAQVVLDESQSLWATSTAATQTEEFPAATSSSAAKPRLADSPTNSQSRNSKPQDTPISHSSQVSTEPIMSCNGHDYIDQCPAGYALFCIQGEGAPLCYIDGSKFCNGKMWDNCPANSIFYCPPTGDSVCYNDTGNTRSCNGKVWAACPAGSTFSCPAFGDAVCVGPGAAAAATNGAAGDSKGSFSDAQLLGAIEQDVKAREAKAQALSSQILAIAAKYKAKQAPLNAQSTAIMAQMKELQAACGGFCWIGENASKSNELSVELLKIANEGSALNDQQYLELGTLTGFSRSYYDPNAYRANVPLYSPSESVVFVSTSHDSYSMRVTSDSMGGYFLQNSMGGPSYRITSGAGNTYYVTAY